MSHCDGQAPLAQGQARTHRGGTRRGSAAGRAFEQQSTPDTELAFPEWHAVDAMQQENEMEQEDACSFVVANALPAISDW